MRDLVHQSPGRPSRVDHLPLSISLLGPVGADQPGKVLGAAEAGHDAQGDFGEAHLRVLRGVDDVAGQRQLQPAPQGVAVHRGDDRLAHLLDEHHYPLPLQGELVPLEGTHRGHFLDIGPGYERLLTCAGND